jgi:hypothetical protein
VIPYRMPLAIAACCGLLLAPTYLLPSAPAGAEETLSLEDVVRLFVQGVSTEDLIGRIETSQVDFDLNEEMLDELRQAELAEEVIEAMVQRQRQLHPPVTPEIELAPEDVAPQAGLTVRLTLQGGTSLRKGDLDRGMRVADLVPPDTLKQLGVRDPEARITNVALYVACHSSTHVPDHWRGQTPLGRDFHSVTRHKMLAFHSEAIPDNADERTVLNLEIPEKIAVELDPTEEHDLSAGVAVQIDGRYYRVVSDESEGFVPAEHEGTIDVTIELPDNLDPSAIAVRLSR